MKKRSGHPPKLLSKSGPMRDRKRIVRKAKHKNRAPLAHEDEKELDQIYELDGW